MAIFMLTLYLNPIYLEINPFKLCQNYSKINRDIQHLFEVATSIDYEKDMVLQITSM